MIMLSDISAALTIDEVASRLKNFPHDQYLYVGSIMRSIALAAGTIVLLEIALELKRYRLLLFPWVATLLACLVTITTWGRGLILTNSRANLLDTILPMFMGIVEVCMFTILSPRILLKHKSLKSIGGGLPEKGFKDWICWFVFFTIHTLLAVILVWNRISQTKVDEDFGKELRPLAEQYVTWMWHDLRGALFGTAVSAASALILLILFRRRKSLKWWCIGFTVFPMAILTGVMIEADHQREMTEAFVFTQSRK